MTTTRSFPTTPCRPKQAISISFGISACRTNTIRWPNRNSKEAVDKYNEENAVDVSRYKAPTDHVYIEEHAIDLYVGRRVRLESAKYFPETGYRSSRITKITRKVNLPSQVDLEISDATSTGAMTTINDNITAVENYVREATSGSFPDLIRSWDNTLPTDNNVFSARRTLKEALSRLRQDTAQEKITFAKGLDIGVYSSLVSGGTFRTDEQGNTYIEADNIFIRKKATIQETQVNRVTHIAGGVYRQLCLLRPPFPGRGVRDVLPLLCGRRECRSRERLHRGGYGDLSGGRPDGGIKAPLLLAQGGRGRRPLRRPLQDGCRYRIGYPRSRGRPYPAGVRPGGGRQRGARATERRHHLLRRHRLPGIKLLQGIGSYTLQGKEVVSQGFDKSTARAFLKVLGDFAVGVPPTKSTYLLYDSTTKTLEIKGKFIYRALRRFGQGA